GFLYFPQAAILYAPFTLPTPLGDILWRWVSLGALAVSVWRLAERVAPEKRAAAFSLATCLALGPALASARNGQMNLLLTALVTLAFIEIADRRWRRAACWLCLGAALKPLMIVPMALAAAVYRPLWRPLLGGVAVLFLLPFFTQHPSYVWQQYGECLHKLFLAGNPGAENPGSDLFGLLSSWGYVAPLTVQTLTRVAAAGATLLLAMMAARRTAFLVFALAACYLALFNPRMENNGFVLLGPVMGWLAAESLLLDGRRAVAIVIAIASLAITFNYQITGGHNFWLCPLMGAVVWLCVVARSLAGTVNHQG
ncbi:MAG TPA: glycosyltransferase family 87 protein, partial [Pirellulales bacterium]